MRRHALKKGRDEGTPWGRDLTRGHALKEGRGRGHDLRKGRDEGTRRAACSCGSACFAFLLRGFRAGAARAAPPTIDMQTARRGRGARASHLHYAHNLPRGEAAREAAQMLDLGVRELRLLEAAAHGRPENRGAATLSQQVLTEAGRTYLAMAFCPRAAGPCLVASKDVRVSRFDCFAAFHQQRSEWL